MKIYCVSIGEKYGPQFEKYLENKLGKINWIREQIAPNVPLQWNKMYPMSLKDTEPVCVIDLDIVLENDYMDLFNYPIERGEFLSIHGWWRDAPGYTLNGGFFKYYPIDCNYIYEKFMSSIEKWKVHYIKNKTTIGPVNGEQYFVEDSVNEKLKLKLAPSSWVTRWKNDYSHIWFEELTKKYTEASGEDYLKEDDWNPNIKLVHYNHTLNYPCG
jgi:hypothetical protein|tara:strand:- start:2728 stop:3369 length:642 start_codon:yes stop_codon:yes gene_type:complete